MRGTVRAWFTGGALVLILFTVAGAVSPETAEPAATPVAFAQPVVLPLMTWHSKPILHESGLLLLVGGGLLGLAAIVRRSTSI